MPRRFTLEEATALLPTVDRLLREAVALKREYASADQMLQSAVERVMAMGGVVLDREPLVSARSRRDRSAESLKNVVEQLQETGCLIKDIDIGLVDFPTLFRKREVYLCWKLGEPEIAFWHGVDEGFAGRKPIDTDFREHHEGEKPQ